MFLEETQGWMMLLLRNYVFCFYSLELLLAGAQNEVLLLLGFGWDLLLLYWYLKMVSKWTVIVRMVVVL